MSSVLPPPRSPLATWYTVPCITHNSGNLVISEVRSTFSVILRVLDLLKDALLACVSEQTAPLDQLDVGQLLVGFSSKKSQDVPSGLASLVAGSFGLLMSTPIEYLTRKARMDLLRRAQSADIALSGPVVPKESTLVVTMVREFQRRVYESQGFVDHPVSAPIIIAYLCRSY